MSKYNPCIVTLWTVQADGRIIKQIHYLHNVNAYNVTKETKALW